MTKIHVFSWKGILAIILLNLTFLFIGIIGFLNYFSSVELQQIVDNGITAEAEIIKLVHDSSKKSDGWTDKPAHRLIYRYTAENGTVYEGECYSGDFRTEEDSYSRIGEKVQIYIGQSRSGEPLSRYVGYGDVDMDFGLIYGSISLGVMILFDVGVIIFAIMKQKNSR